MTNQATEQTSASRPRIIERWFPCAEVSAASASGWGSSNSETLLMTWFAKRPLAQSRAAVLCSLLPWPEDAEDQERVAGVVRESLGSCQDPDWYACRLDDCDDVDCSRTSHMAQARREHAHSIVDCARRDSTGGYNAARRDILQLLRSAYPDRPAEMLDPFAGRGLIPLEAARYGQHAHAIDYSPVATLASRLLIDWPFRDWSTEPELPFEPYNGQPRTFDPSDPLRLIHDIDAVQSEVQRRIEVALDKFYPDNGLGNKPWGYLWAQLIPCDGCGRTFPLYGSNILRKPANKDDPGCSFKLIVSTDTWSVEVVDRVTAQPPTMRTRGNKRGKLAWCPYADCGHAHELTEHKRLVSENYGRAALLVVADLHGTKKMFRPPNEAETTAANDAAHELANSPDIAGLPPRPNESHVAGTSVHIRATEYGATDFGDLSNDRQNLLHAEISRAIGEIGHDLTAAGCSDEYVRALTGYCGAALARKLRRSTRGVTIASSRGGVTDVFINESSLGFNYDYFEVGISAGPGSWRSVSGVPSSFTVLCSSTSAQPSDVARGSALAIPASDSSMDAVVTDPPYEFMIAYTDASDLTYVWLRRALSSIHPDFLMTADPRGLQEKSEELIVKQNYFMSSDEHRTPEYYRSKIALAFTECCRVVHPDGVVSIVFGHGDPDAWRALLDAISEAGLVLTGAWPATTEKGGAAGSANINTTLTLACRPAPSGRPQGRVAEVDAEMRRVISDRVKNVWGPSGLSYVDQKMAAAGPALEVVGRYERILDKKGQPVDLTRYLPLARQAVTDAHDLRFDSLPLETFDQKTRFALEWARAYGRRVQAASEARWQRLAADLEEHDTDGVLTNATKGVRLITSKEAKVEPVEGMPLFEVALVAAAAWRAGSLADAATVIRKAGVDPQDQHFWACIDALSKALPETDTDGTVWTAMVRNRDALAAGVANAEAAVRAARTAEQRTADEQYHNPHLFDDPNSLFGSGGN